jgi:hypothetical protein
VLWGSGSFREARALLGPPHAEPAELVREIQAELLDVSGWSFVLYQRLEDVRVALEQQRAA